MREEAKDVYAAFAAWLDEVLTRQIPTEVVAFVFNIYEGEDSFDVQLAGCSMFEEDDDDWAASDVFSSGEDLFEIARSKVGNDWKSALAMAKDMAARYLAEDTRAEKLGRSKAIAVGFVDGDLDVIRSIA